MAENYLVAGIESKAFDPERMSKAAEANQSDDGSFMLHITDLSGLTTKCRADKSMTVWQVKEELAKLTGRHPNGMSFYFDSLTTTEHKSGGLGQPLFGSTETGKGSVNSSGSEDEQGLLKDHFYLEQCGISAEANALFLVVAELTLADYARRCRIAKQGNNDTTKVTLIGGAGSGKTALIRAIIGEPYEPAYITTVGAGFQQQHIAIEDASGAEILRRQRSMQMWDTAGHVRYHGLLPLYMKNARAIFLCYDRSSHDIESIAVFMKLFSSENETCSFDGAELFVIGTKSDLPVCQTTVDMVEATLTASESYFSEHNIGYEPWRHVAVSAKENPQSVLDVLFAATAVVLGRAPMQKQATPDETASGATQGQCCSCCIA
jgi:GTPase SAR1 family protein